MIASRYNLHSVSPEGEHLLYNTATGRFACCGPEALQCLETGQGEWAQQLADTGFLVDDNFDEALRQAELFQRFREDHGVLHLCIAPTYACNCRCAYCYEQDKLTEKSLMTPQVEEAVVAFTQDRLDSWGCSALRVEWYGGDPQLCLDIVERLSQKLIALCRQRAVNYSAMMLSNSTLIGNDQAKLLARCEVSSMLITIDGPKDLHNARRPAVGIDDPFSRIMGAIDALQAQGIQVNAMMNADKVNMARLPELRELLAEKGVDVMPAKLNDYAHSYGCERFAAPDFDLYTHEEFSHANFQALADAGLTKPQLRAMLAPGDHFCSGHMESSFVVDYKGDVYKCDGWMGDPSRALFNLTDGSRPVLDNIAFDPIANERCSTCDLLPLCWGNCSWERERCNWPCHPLRYAQDDYLTAYRNLYPARTEEFQLLA